jgi:hypothetical protein
MIKPLKTIIMLINGQKVRKEEFLAIKSELSENGITISVKGKKYRIDYPPEIWKAYSDTNKELLLDNLTFLQTCHLPASHGKKGAVYSTALPLFETFAFKSTMYDIPSTAVIDKKKTAEYIKGFFNSDFLFSSYDVVLPDPAKKKKNGNSKKTTAVILFTAGKESLLTLALCLEMGITPIPVYINEDTSHPEAKHKRKIIARMEEDYGMKIHTMVNDPGKMRYCDLGEEGNNWGAGAQLITYVLSVMPFVDYFDADHILFGNEYSCDSYSYDEEGFKSCVAFDQSSEWAKQLNIIAKMLSNRSVEVGSLVAPLQEIGLLRILHERYPQLGKLQMSCFSDTEEGKDRIWCGNCSKCARLFGFFKGLGIDTDKIGFQNNMFTKPNKKHFSLFGGEGLCYDALGVGSEEQAFAMYMASRRGAKGYLMDQFKKLPQYKEIKTNFRKLHKKYFSIYENIATPYELKEQLMDIFDETFQGNFKPKDFRLKHIKEAEELEEKEELIEQK